MLTAAPAAASDLGSGFSINGGATIVSDYRFRGISQTDEDFAIQGTLTLSHESGFYATVWGSSIDDYVAALADAELDLIGGWRHTWGGTTLDVGVLYYYYSGGCCDIDTDFVEPYASVSHVFGPVTAKALVAYAPSQSALSIGAGDEDNLYVAGDVSATIPGTPVGLTAHLGHSFGPSYITIGDEYTDWSLGATVTVSNFVLGLSYVDTDGTFITPTGRNASDGTVVFSAGVSF
jgi:uncharacterized protein (TIGR02001 family)